MKTLKSIVILLAIVAIGCNRSPKVTNEVNSSDGEVVRYQLVKFWSTDTTLLVPECVLYDAERNLIYVSNLNFEPRLKDGNGFISKLAPDGEILELKWIADMSSPKGMALVGNKLYVTDVDELIEMDVDAGEITGRWIIDGAKMLNDIAADDEGGLFISDSDGNSIYKFEDGGYELWLDEGLSAPNGLLFEPERLLLASMGSEDFTAIDYLSKEITLISDSINKGDGIVTTGIPGNYIVSDWLGQVFYIYPDGTKEVLLRLDGEQEQTADMGFIEKDRVLLIPTFYGNQVIAYKLEKE